jgi:hypothetical protein
VVDEPALAGVADDGVLVDGDVAGAADCAVAGTALENAVVGVVGPTPPAVAGVVTAGVTPIVPALTGPAPATAGAPLLGLAWTPPAVPLWMLVLDVAGLA